MNSAQSLTFLWTTWSLAVSILIFAVVAILSFIAWRRSGYRRNIALLELLRLTIVAFVLLILNQPEWVEQFRPEEKPTFAILWDGSKSMTTRDVATKPGQSSQIITRHDAIEPLTKPEFWKSLDETFSTVIQPFSNVDPANGTDLYTPLADAPEKIKNLRAIVLASDGDWNLGQPPVQAASILRLKGIPVFAVPAGSASRLPDIELLALDTPTFGVRGKAVRIPFTIDSALPREYATTVKLKTSDGDELTKEVRIAPMGRTNDSIVWKPKDVGDFSVTLEIPNHPDELSPENNSLTTPISIREEKLRVLIVESLPRWEYRYLRNALSRDPGVEVSCLLFHPGLTKPGGGSSDYIKSFPSGLDELAKYDVVFLGDVGIEPGQLTSDDCRLLKGLVEHQASGLVFLPGWQGRQMSLLGTDLADLYPVQLDDSQPGGWGSRTPSQFELTELGARSLLTKLADTQEENIDVWESLPGFQWYAPVIRAKPGAEVLSVHKDAINEFGRLPLLVTRTYGAGKILFMGTDGAWRWRKGVEDKYHYRFWGQVVRWMAYQRNMAKGETMRLYYSPEQPQLGQTISLATNVMETSGEPLAKGDVTARIVAPSGKAQTVRFASTGEEWGAFTARFTPDEPGQHKLTLSCKQTSGTLEASFFVQGVDRERVGRPARPDVLEEIARVTRGKLLHPENIDQVLLSLAELPEPPPSVRRIQLWCHPITATILVLLFAIFWTARKIVGLI